MSFLDTLLSKLTDVFQKNTDSNVGKIFSIASTQLDDIESTLNRMEEWRDIDLAEGKALDLLGERIVGEFRGASDDEEYRWRIKSRIATNFLTFSDIESVNKIFESYLKEHYVGVQECWNLNDGTPFDGEPAALFVTVNGNNNPYGIPFEYLRPIGTGGIRTNWNYVFKERFNLSDEYERWLYPFENFAGHMVAGGDSITNGNALYQASLEISSVYSKADNPYLICGDYISGDNGNASYTQDVELSDSYSTQLNDYFICGDYVSGDNLSKNYNSDFELSGGYSSFLQSYPICGIFVAGEVI